VTQPIRPDHGGHAITTSQGDAEFFLGAGIEEINGKGGDIHLPMVYLQLGATRADPCGIELLNENPISIGPGTLPQTIRTRHERFCQWGRHDTSPSVARARLSALALA
jgi:hypothetical protein